MSAWDGYLIAFGAAGAYALAVVALWRAGRIGPDRALTLFGPALMLKTKWGIPFLERVGRFRRFWTVAGDLGLVLALIAMGGVLAVLAFDAFVALRIPASAAPQPAQALGIPGLNPIIPLGYGIVALVIGIVLHELMHGIVARSQRIGVKSVGILWLVVPIGAFVEQDDEEMRTASRRFRGRVAAAGILGNFALTVVFFLLLAGVVSTSVTPNAEGVGVAYVLPGFPADNASLSAGDIITSVNGTAVTTPLGLTQVLNHTRVHQTVALSFYSRAVGHPVTTSATLAPLSSYTHNTPSDDARAFLGVSLTFLTPSQLKAELADPLASPYGAVPGAITWIVLPLAGLEPIQGTTASFFHVAGPLSPLGSAGFWILANLLFWLAWMNLLLGISNALPLVPLDGGLLFRDLTAGLAARIRPRLGPAALERLSSRAVAFSSALVIFLLAWQFIAPRL